MINAFWIWRKELAYLSLFLIIAGVLSYFIGYFIYMVVLILMGAICWQIVQLSALEKWLRTGAGGKIPSASGIWGDIYYHFYRIKKAEKKRKKTLGNIIDQFRKSTDVLPDAAIVLGVHDEIEWSNKLSKMMLGIKKSDKGQRIDNLIRVPEFVAFLKSKDESLKFFMPSPVDGRIILQFRMVSYGNRQHLIIAHDVTQQKNMEAMRKNFVDNVSHELRTPLTVLKGYLETLQDMDDNQSPLLTKSLIQMRGQTERMQYLVDDLLLLARLETQKKNEHCVDMHGLISKICIEMGAVAEHEQRLKFQLTENVNIIGEEQALCSAFTNLVVNALKYSAVDTTVQVVWKKTAKGIVFEVIDHGEGIPAADIPRVTERFYRVEAKRTKKRNGTGLGLAIVKHVLIRHDARLEITSKVGYGSRFSCIFPHSRLCSFPDKAR